MKNFHSFLMVMGIFLCTVGSYAQDPLTNVTFNATHVSDAVGGAAANAIVSGTDPFGNTSDLFETTAANGSYPGFKIDNIAIDHTKSYRFSFWLKTTNAVTPSFAGYVKSNSATGIARGGQDYDYTYMTGNFKLPTANEWYLYVGFIKGNQDTNDYIGKQYDLSNNSTLNAYNGNSWNTSSTSIMYHMFMYNTTDPNDKIYIYDPRIEEVSNGDDSVTDLLPSGGDTQAPTAPTLSSTTNTDTAVDLSWSGATDNTAVTGYKVFKDGSLEATLGTISTYQVTGLTASTSYNFTVKALDAAGNESVASNTVNVTTNASSGGGSGNWNLSGNDLNYTAGNVAVGTSTVPSGYKMAVDGKLITEEVKVQLSGNWPDYVFKDDYDLPTLEEIQRHIDEKGHLPNIPSAKEVKANGIKVGEMNKLLLEKIEELTLYTLQQERRITNQQMTIEQQEEQIRILKKLESRIVTLEASLKK